MSNKKNKSAVDIILDPTSSASAKSEATKELWIESKEDLNYQCKEGYRFIDLLILHTLDYNGIGHSEKLISKFLNQYGKNVISIIEKDTTEDNPIALITRHRSSSILLKQLLDQIDFSEENIEAKPGLKMLTTTFKAITPMHFSHPSDFVLLLDEKLSKYENLNKFTNELKTAYAVSNLFKHKEITQEVLDSFGLIAQKSLVYTSYSKNLDNDLNANPSYLKVVNDGLKYLNKMNSSDIEIFKSKVEKELICDLTTLDEKSLYKMKDNISDFNLDKICQKLNLVDNIKISNGYKNAQTLDQYNANLLIRNLTNKIHEVSNLSGLGLDSQLVAQRISELNDSNEFKNFKNYYDKTKNNNKIIAIDDKQFKQINELIENLEKIIESEPKKTIKQDFTDMELADLGMTVLHIHINEPFVEKIFNKLSKQFKKQDIENSKLIGQITGIVQLDGILPNRNEILKNINANFADLWENKLILSKNGEIIKNPSLDDAKLNQELLLKQKQNKELIDPLIDELLKINLLFKDIFIAKDSIVATTDEKQIKTAKLK